MGTMPVNKLLISMSLPIIISMLVQALYNIVDSIFVAQINKNALTAVSLAYPVQNLMIAIASGTGVGVNSFVSKCLGAKDYKFANKAANVTSSCNHELAGTATIWFNAITLVFQNPDRQCPNYTIRI